MGIALGAAIGYGCVYLVEMMDTSFKDIHEVKEELNFPLLGAMSVIITEEEFNQRKKSSRFVCFLVSLFFVVMVATVIVFSIIR